MKVKELIEELKKLDQEKGIWVVYDGFTAFPPIPNETVEDESYLIPEDGMLKGDYVIWAG